MTRLPGTHSCGPSHLLRVLSVRIPLLALALGLSACDLPLAMPDWDTGWTLVVAADTIDVDGLLPDGVRRLADGFAVDSLASRTDVRLEEVCEFCTCFQGPVPALEITPFDWPVPLPVGIAGATLRTGTAGVELTNDIPFDLLDGGEKGMGHLTILLLDLRSGEVLDSLRLEEPFPPGATLRAGFDLAGLVIHRAVVARVRGAIPGTTCPPEPLTPEMGIRTAVEFRDVVAGEVQVVLQDADLNLPLRPVDLPPALGARLRPGETRVVLDVELESAVPVEVAGLLSVAAGVESLFTATAALYTPLPMPPASPGGTTRLARSFLLDLDALDGAETLYLSTRNRVVGNRTIRVTGEERFLWRVTLRSEIPIR